MRSIERPFDPETGSVPMTALQLAPSLPSSARLSAPQSRGRTRRIPRLTRRGRAVIVLVVAGLLLAAFSLGRVSSTASTSGESPGAADLRHVVVADGENLWAIAQRAVPGADPRVTVDRI